MFTTFLRTLWRLIRIVFFAAFFGTPLVAFWLASSLTAYLDAPTGWALAAGLAVFPVLPALWEARAAWKRSRLPKPPERWFKLGERLSLRTFTVAAAFSLALLAMFPRVAFVALSTRGDWMLDGRQGLEADRLRRALFASADALEWLYRFARTNPYEAFVENQVDRVAQLWPHPDATTPLWPWKDPSLHPAVAAMPRAAETSIEAVARYLARAEHDPFLRVKALHDWVADRIAYDAPALKQMNIPPQEAGTIFRKRIGVCAGYSNLLAALGAVVNCRIVVVTGHAKDDNGTLGGIGHAWNAAQIDGKWYLIDATWNAGYVDEKGFTRRYRTQYLLPPPAAMALDHLPKDPRWQLLARPLSEGEFLRQPMLKPSFLAHGLKLVSPLRSQVEVNGEAVIMITNPRKLWLFAQAEQGGKRIGESTRPTDSGTARIACPLLSPGTYRVNLFVNAERSETYENIGSVDFQNGKGN